MNYDFTLLGIALGLGLLVGLQRERIQSRIAGIRTFSLITLFGTISGLIAREAGQNWIVPAGVISIALLMAAANFLKDEKEEKDIGQTTEIAALLMYVLGAYLVIGTLILGVVAGAVIALLLYLKAFFKDYVARLGEEDLQAIMIFVAVTLVVLPILPDTNFGPYNILNVREIWLMVVLIVGISISGYFAYKWLGGRVGAGLSGILGGLISSTATTVTYSKQSRAGQVTYLAAFIIIAASAVSFIRVVIEIGVVAPTHLLITAPPLLIVSAVSIVYATILFLRKKQPEADLSSGPANPAQFKTAVIFAILYAVILVAIAFAKDTFGPQGLYIVSIISGLTDMDAITLSLANMMNTGRILPDVGWRYILVAALSNLVFKAGMVAFLGHRRVLSIVGMAFGLTIIAGFLVLLFW